MVVEVQVVVEVEVQVEVEVEVRVDLVLDEAKPSISLVYHFTNHFSLFPFSRESHILINNNNNG